MFAVLKRPKSGKKMKTFQQKLTFYVDKKEKMSYNEKVEKIQRELKDTHKNIKNKGRK